VIYYTSVFLLRNKYTITFFEKQIYLITKGLQHNLAPGLQNVRAGPEHDRHIVRMAPGVSRMTTVREVLTKLKLDLCFRDEVLAPSDARPDRHPRLPHSPSNKPH
jgi:hypothetical protein